MRTEALRMDRVTYIRDGVKLLDNFNFQIYRGEIMGLIPLDNLGVDAMLELIQHNSSIHYGFVYLHEQLVNSYNRPRGEQTDNRVSVVAAESGLVDTMSVADNVYVLRPGYRGQIINGHMIAQQLSRITQELGIQISPERKIKRLSGFERYTIEIIRAVISSAKLIILQDISTIMGYDDVLRLQKILRHYAAQGVTFLYICLHYEELFQVCNRAALMANGHIIKILNRAFMTEEVMKHYSIQAQLKDKLDPDRENLPQETAPVIFQMRSLWYHNIRNMSFHIRTGECVAMHASENAVFGDLVRVLSCVEPERGRIELDRQKLSMHNCRKLAVILENPAENMVFYGMNYLDNLCLTLDHRLTNMWLSHRIRLSVQTEFQHELGADVFRRPVKDLTIRQRHQLVYTRVLLQKPKIVFCIQPFQGADVELREYICSLMKRLLSNHIAVVLLAVNLRDTLNLADRLLVIQGGSVTCQIERKNFSNVRNLQQQISEPN